MKTQRGNIVTWLLLIIILVIGGYLLWKYQLSAGPQEEFEPITQEETEEKPKKKFREPTEEEKLEMDEEALLDALKSASPEDCENIRFNDDIKEECLDNTGLVEALNTNNKAGCDLITNPVLRQECIDQVNYTSALGTADINLCQSIVDTELKQQCLDLLNADLGKTAQTEEECNVINNETTRDRCKTQVKINTGVANLDVSSCDSITDAIMKERCTETIEVRKASLEAAQASTGRVILTTTEQLKSCDELEGVQQESCQNNANYDLAYEKKDITFCNAITEVTLKAKCFADQGSRINQYYLNRAKRKSDPSQCEFISDTSAKAYCLQVANPQ